MRDWIPTLAKIGALWIHDGNSARPHALLTSGQHSNGFFNGSCVINNPQLLEAMCRDLIELHNIDIGDEQPKWIVGSAYGAITIAYQLALILETFTGFSEKPVPTLQTLLSGLFVEWTLKVTTWCRTVPWFRRLEVSIRKQMLINRFEIKPGDTVLVAEDVLSTGGTTQLTINALKALGAEVLPYVIVLVNRSGRTHLGHRQILALIDHEMPMWQPSECPLCAQGSEAIRPKGAWARLTADY